MYSKDFMKLTLSQFVAEVYENDFNGFSLQAQLILLPEFGKGSNLEFDFSSSCHKCHFWAIFLVST